MESLHQIFNNTRLILTIDRLDYSKGILQHTWAFDMLLEKFPGEREKVSMYMIVVPSVIMLPGAQRELRNEIDKLCSNINALYRTLTGTPVNYFGTVLPR